MDQNKETKFREPIHHRTRPEDTKHSKRSWNAEKKKPKPKQEYHFFSSAFALLLSRTQRRLLLVCSFLRLRLPHLKTLSKVLLQAVENSENCLPLFAPIITNLPSSLRTRVLVGYGQYTCVNNIQRCQPPSPWASDTRKCCAIVRDLFSTALPHRQSSETFSLLHFQLDSSVLQQCCFPDPRVPPLYGISHKVNLKESSLGCFSGHSVW